MVCLAKCLGVCLRTKWLWVRIPLLSHNPVSLLKHKKSDNKHSILLQVNNDIYNQMLLINQQEGLQVPYYYQLLSSVYLSLKEDNVVEKVFLKPH